MTKQLFSALLASVALAGSAFAQSTNIYENDGNVIVPPQIAPNIDAVTFINKGLFDINLPINFTQTGEVVTYFETKDTLNFTNRNTLSGSTGYKFDFFNGSTRTNAAIFLNSGTITVGLSTNTNVLNNLNGFVGTAQIITLATNITNSGLMEVGADGLISLTGGNVNLTRGTVKVENAVSTNNLFFGAFGFFGIFANPIAGIFDQFWGTGVNTNQSFFLAANNSIAISAVEQVGSISATTNFAQIVATNVTAFANVFPAGPSNTFIQVVLLGNSSPGVTADVRFDGGGFFFFNDFAVPVIHWQGIITNRNGPLVTNDLYLSDTFGSDGFFDPLLISGFIGIPPFITVPTMAPENFAFSTTFSNYNTLPTGNTPFDPSLIANPNPTNRFSIYGVNLSPLTAQTITGLPGSSITNLPGRIQISASQVLDLTRTIMNGGNYLTLSATNHYVGSTNAAIVSPYYDINLASTNGTLAVSNLVAPFTPHLIGSIGMWSDGYTNIVNGITNIVNVLIVNSSLQDVSPVTVQNLQLSSTNVIISDILNITNLTLLKAVNLTTTTNDLSSASGDGEINLISSQIVWSGITPLLSNITNSGGISTLNSVFFAGSRQPPFFSTTFTEPYQSFVNHGFVSVAGGFVWANYFENSSLDVSNSFVPATNAVGTFTNHGLINCYTGPFTLQSGNALMSNGIIQAQSDISLGSGSLIISNHVLKTGGALTLNVTNLLTDTGTNSSNVWQASFGINLPVKPTTGDLLGTTITNFALPNFQVQNLWAGEDRGPTVAGFLNNAAIGHLVLDGGDSQAAFLFSGPSAQNAIYIDQIELKDGATNRESRFINGQVLQTFTAVDASPGMTIYFADAIASGQDISEKLNGNLTDSGGQVVWVPSFAGLFSSTNVTYPSGRTFTLNRALVISTDIDSNGNGTNNAFDPAPVFVSEDVNPSVIFTNTPAPAAIISWQTLAGAGNSLFTSTSLIGTNWTLVTNFIAQANGQVSVTNTAPGNGPRYYKVRVDPVQP